MPPYLHYQTRPLTTEFPEGDGYRQLIIAVLQRAVADALGATDLRGNVRPAAKLQYDARHWLMAEQGATALLELGGYQAEVVLRPIRQRVLGGEGAA